MIYLITGTNAYQIEQETKRIAEEVGVPLESVEANSLDENGLADIMRGASLFSTKRLVLIRGLSEHKTLWDLVAAWADVLSQDTTLILVEEKPDRRTKTYKTLAAHAKLIQTTQWTDRERGNAETWTRELAGKHHVSLTRQQIADIVARSMVPAERGMVVDQFQIVHAIEALSLLDTVTDEAIATVLPAAMQDVLFELMGYAANREETRVYESLADIRLNEDPYRVFSMLTAEWSRLVAVAVAGKTDAASIATELGIHPFVIQKLQKLSTLFTRTELHELTRLAAEIDTGMKLSQFTPWDGIDRFVLGIAFRS